MVQLSVADAIQSIIGGFLISMATSLHLLLKGRITGFSGIYYSIVTLEQASLKWKAALISGMVIASAVLYDIFKFGTVWDTTRIFDSPTVMAGNQDFIGFAIAGFLVGVGTKMGNGCTSGHGVCGMPRFSLRSWVAVGTFMSLAMGIATFKYYIPFLNGNQGIEMLNDFNFDATANIFLGIGVLVFLVCLSLEKEDKIGVIVAFFTGIIFGLGLGFGGMLRKTKIIGFLALRTDWDPSLLFLFASAVGFNMITFYLIINQKGQPIFAPKLEIPTSKQVDARLIAGASIFGLGWGFGGFCPGPGMALLPIFSLQVSVVWLGFLALGQVLVATYDKHQANKIMAVSSQINTVTKELVNNDKESGIPGSEQFKDTTTFKV